MENILEKLKNEITQLTKNGELYTTAISGLSLFRRTEPTEPLNIIYEPSLCVIAQGEKSISLNEDTFIYNANNYLLTSVHVPIIAQIIKASPQEPYLGLRIKLNYQEIAKMIMDYNLSISVKHQSINAVATGKMNKTILSTILRIVCLLKTEKDITVLAPLMQKELIYHLLNAEQGWQLKEIVSQRSRSQQIAKVINWLKENYMQSFHIQDLAHMAGMSVSTFHQHFRNLTQLSPLQFQKQLRLQEARLLMFEKHYNAADAAFRVGYESPSQFNREYRRLFGETPLKDISKLREIFIA